MPGMKNGGDERDGTDGRTDVRMDGRTDGRVIPWFGRFAINRRGNRFKEGFG